MFTRLCWVTGFHTPPPTRHPLVVSTEPCTLQKPDRMAVPYPHPGVNPEQLGALPRLQSLAPHG